MGTSRNGGGFANMVSRGMQSKGVSSSNPAERKRGGGVFSRYTSGDEAGSRDVRQAVSREGGPFSGKSKPRSGSLSETIVNAINRGPTKAAPEAAPEAPVPEAAAVAPIVAKMGAYKGKGRKRLLGE